MSLVTEVWMGVRAEVQDAMSQEYGSVLLGATSKVPIFVSLWLAVALCYQGSHLGAGALTYRCHLGISSLGY